MLRGRRLPVSPCQLPRCGIGFQQVAATAATPTAVAAARFLSDLAPLAPKTPPPKQFPPEGRGRGHDSLATQLEAELLAWDAEREEQLRRTLNTPASQLEEPLQVTGVTGAKDGHGTYMDATADKYFPDVDSMMRETEQEVEFTSIRRVACDGPVPFRAPHGKILSQYKDTGSRKRLKSSRNILDSAVEAARDAKQKAAEQRAALPDDPYLTRLVKMGHQPFMKPPLEMLQQYPKIQLEKSSEIVPHLMIKIPVQTQDKRLADSNTQRVDKSRAQQKQENGANATLDEADAAKLDKIAANSAVALGLKVLDPPFAAPSDNPSFVELDVQPTWYPFRGKSKPSVRGRPERLVPKERTRPRSGNYAKVRDRGRFSVGLAPFEPAALSAEEERLYRQERLPRDLSHWAGAPEPTSKLIMSPYGVTSERTPPAVHSVFSLLFPKASERPISRSSFLKRSPYGPASALDSAQATEEMDPQKKYFVDVPASSPAAPGSIFDQLFPGLSPPGTATTQANNPAEQMAAQDKDQDTLFISIRNEVRNWIPEKDKASITAPQPGQYGSQSTVVILSGLSNTLVDSDFYRIIPEGAHVEGWAGGLVKCVQARNALTYEPLGQYFLMFHSRPAAEAFVKEVERLHHLSRRLNAIHKSKSKSKSNNSTSSSASAPPPLTDDERGAVQNFTLFPPRIQPKIQMHMWGTKLISQLAERTNIADVVQALKPEAETPAKVLLLLNNGAASPARGLTVAELWLTLRDDGRERGVPWAMLNLKEGIRPIRLRYSRTASARKVKFRRDVVDVAFAEGETGERLFDEMEMTGRALHRISPQHDVALYMETAATFKDVTALGEEALWGEDVDSRESEDGFNAAATATTDKKAWDSDGSGSGSGSGSRGKRLGWDKRPKDMANAAVSPHERFNRYLLTFKQRSIARRFVRCWHKRPIWDPETNRAVVVDAIALM